MKPFTIVCDKSWRTVSQVCESNSRVLVIVILIQLVIFRCCRIHMLCSVHVRLNLFSLLVWQAKMILLRFLITYLLVGTSLFKSHAMSYTGNNTSAILLATQAQTTLLIIGDQRYVPSSNKTLIVIPSRSKRNLGSLGNLSFGGLIDRWSRSTFLGMVFTKIAKTSKKAPPEF